jgi:peptide chain release factor 3
MEIEKQRGISVTTSVMEFDYNDYKVNILDTPGHQDFAEDTFRTLTAVDSAIIVVDSAKGVETQTRKLMTVCRMRKTPVIIFINKMDREGKDPFDLLDELENELQIKVRPLSWPINQGQRFKGVYNIYEEKLDLFTPDKQKVTEKVAVDINSDELEAHVGEDDAEKLRMDLELVDGVYPEFDVNTYLNAEVAPVFFGSALNNFGVKELLDCFVKIAPSPRPTKAEERMVLPEEPKFSGFIFKITANIDPNHRSCIAFCKVCSGKFVRNAPYLHIRQNKTLRFSSPTQFMAQKKSTIDEAYPGDIVGLPDSGIFKIGDTLTEGEKIHFRGLPSFSPEHPVFVSLLLKKIVIFFDSCNFMGHKVCLKPIFAGFSRPRLQSLVTIAAGIGKERQAAEQHNRTNHRGDERGECPHRIPPKQRDNPTTQQTADYTHHNIHKKA